MEKRRPSPVQKARPSEAFAHPLTDFAGRFAGDAGGDCCGPASKGTPGAGDTQT